MSERALSIQQPWVYPILVNAKDVENRRWRPTTTQLPLRLWVHASKAFDVNAPSEVAGFVLPEADSEFVTRRTGTICGLVTLESVHHASACRGACSPWAADGQWHWKFDRAHAVEPVPARGSLGLWEVPEDVLARLYADGSEGDHG